MFCKFPYILPDFLKWSLYLLVDSAGVGTRTLWVTTMACAVPDATGDCNLVWGNFVEVINLAYLFVGDWNRMMYKYLIYRLASL
jgi:hypothetical protein